MSVILKIPTQYYNQKNLDSLARDGYFFLYIYHRSLIRSDVTFLQTSGPEDHSEKRSMYCVIKCVETKRVLNTQICIVFHSCNAKTQKTQICVTRPQCVNVFWLQEEEAQIHMSESSQNFTFTKNVGRGFILCSTPPTRWTV
jgi:hypothetical protein